MSASSSLPSPSKKPGVFVHTFGCQMNVHDSLKIQTILGKDGYQTVDTPEEADVILLNTCSVREKPEQKVLSAAGRYRLLKRTNPDLVIGVGGCFARQEGQSLLERSPALDLVFGPDNIPELPDLIRSVQGDRQRIAETAFDPAEDVRWLDIAQETLPSKVAAMVTIMKGCDKFCSFCIVPHVRGRERYRPAPEIQEEIARLTSQGVKEILLLGQSVTSYRWLDPEGSTWTLARLLRSLDRTPGLARLRFTSPYPRDFSDELIACFGDLPSLCEHAHLPLQSGSDRILFRMNRRHTRDQYLAWIEALRSRVPSIALSTDLIVGFPGEDESDFEDTMDILERVRFDQVFSFKYSPRPHTPAARKAQIPEDIKQRRILALQTRQNQISWEKNQALVGTTQEVLVEGPAEGAEGRVIGRTRSHKIVHFAAPPDVIGRLVHVRITQGMLTALAAEIL